MIEDINLRLAKRQVAALKGFYIHFAVFIVVMCALFVIDAATGPGWWVQWPLLGWGIGILAHAAAVFARSTDPIESWEAKKIAEVKSRLDERRPSRPTEPPS
jgi:2TM domain